ncbi:MAG: hypothetical protein ACOYM3_15825 [Terrimicrobiaceae bacterium]
MEPHQMTPAGDQQVLNELRGTILRMVYHAREGHIPSAFSVVDILYTLYRYCLRVDPVHPDREDRDYFLLSKGHSGTALYPVLAHFGFFEADSLLQYCKPGSRFGGHPDALKVPGVEICSGSLGHGIAMGVGLGLGLRLKNITKKVVVLVGDGEMEEGSFWESIMMARNTGLTNLIVIADCNNSQGYSHPFDFIRILQSFDWATAEVNGHDVEALEATLRPLIHGPLTSPTFVAARTRKGHGIARFVGEHAWHRRTPTESELRECLEELK